MPVQIKFDKPPAGYAITSARPNEMLEICVREFTSSEDGDLFINRLDGTPSTIIGMLPQQKHFSCSTVDHLLAIIRQDGLTTVYVNELTFRSKIQAKRSIEAGEGISKDDIADIERLDFPDVAIPKDAGIVFLFSVGWRKGLFYDFGPLAPDFKGERDYDPEVLFGQYYAYLLFQERLKISDGAWKTMLEQRWFPFISLSTGTIEKMVNHAENGWEIDDLLDSIVQEAAPRLKSSMKKWESRSCFKEHFEILTAALERYSENDYVSANSILWLRIEGILRGFHLTKSKKRPNQHDLVNSVVASVGDTKHSCSLLLPDRFRQYLEEVFFKDFDHLSPKDVSRHTIGHGVAPPKEFSRKNATIAFLMLEQLSYYLTT